MEDCIFCQIIGGQIPSYKIYEDANTYALLSIANDFYGHTLVLPKTHSVNLLDATPAVIAHTMNTAQKIARHFVDKLGFDGVNVFINNGESAEQTVFHFHVHIVPRRRGATHNWWKGKLERNLGEEQATLRLSE